MKRRSLICSVLWSLSIKLSGTQAGVVASACLIYPQPSGAMLPLIGRVL